jgi:spermidine synthase
MATFFEVFPNSQVFANLNGSSGYDVVLMGRVGDEPINIDSLATRLQQPQYERVMRSLSEVGFNSVYDLYGTFAGSSDDLREWLTGAVINRDKDLRLQYLAGLALNRLYHNVIYYQIVDSRQWPSQTFSGSEDGLHQLASALVH